MAWVLSGKEPEVRPTATRSEAALSVRWQLKRIQSNRAVEAGVVPVVALGQPGGASGRLELEEADLMLQIDQLFGCQSTVRSGRGIELYHSLDRTNVRAQCQVKNYKF